MKKIRSFFRSPMGTTFMFMMAVLLLMTGTIGGVRATPQIFNPDFAYSGVELDQIGITLVENGSPVSSRDYNRESEEFDYTSNSNDPKMGTLLANMLGNEKLKIGKKYPEVLSVTNSGTITEYVRVTVYKYWVPLGESEDKNAAERKDEPRYDVYDANGEDVLNKLIELNFLEGNGWVIDHSSDTKERTVLYYQTKLASGASTAPFTDTLRINDKIVDYGVKVPTDESGLSWTWTWAVDGLEFRIEAEADGVQDHNARAAMKSAWGLTDTQIDALGIKVDA